MTVLNEVFIDVIFKCRNRIFYITFNVLHLKV